MCSEDYGDSWIDSVFAEIEDAELQRGQCIMEDKYDSYRWFIKTEEVE